LTGRWPRQSIAQFRFQLCARVKVDVQARVQLAQFGQARKQARAGKQRRHAQMQAHDIAGLHLRSDRFGQIFQLWADRRVKGMAVIGQLHRLMLAREQAFAHEIFQRANAA
jgi:hypothetical protein